MRMKMILKRKELKMNEYEGAAKTPQGGDDRENSCLGKLLHLNCPFQCS